MRAPAQTFAKARNLRKDLSLPEVVLWDCLRGGRLSGLRFRRQHAIGTYVLDFYCPAVQLAIEVDGAHHDLRDQMRHDMRRDQALGQRGIRVMRIAATDILDESALEGVLTLIADVAAGAEVPVIHSTRVAEMPTPPPPPTVVPLPRFAGEDQIVPAGLDADPPLFTGEGDHAQHGGGGTRGRSGRT